MTWKKHIFLALAALAVAFVIYEMAKAFRAGVADIKSIIAAPFNTAASIWDSIKKAFTFGGGGSSSSNDSSAGLDLQNQILSEEPLFDQFPTIWGTDLMNGVLTAPAN